MSTQPRSTRLRILLTFLMFLGTWSLLAPATTLDLQPVRILGVKLDIAGPASFLPILALYAFLATRVSERWYYALWLCLPIANIYVSWKISWRVAYLPWRDWELREGEARRPHDLDPPPAKRHEEQVQVRTD